MGDNALTGLLPGGFLSVNLFSESQYDEKWAEAEFITAGLIQGIQPSTHSEGKRRAVIGHVERLIRKYFDCQVCTCGSVPLKTYLPDGDIDLTAFSRLPRSNETWANDLRRILKREDHNRHGKLRVKEVQIIHAEVQIVKCLVENVIVDISFNQLGALCTLCFLEEVDRLIGRDHLFKRSIILVKAWCYYESRILGAHHGLISTYALETLVLYIFNIFHASLRGPFEVLYKFLQFFSQFDWEHYCLSIWGPIHLSALQVMAAEPPQKNGDKLLLSHEFLFKCSQVYGVLPVGGQDFQGRIFNSKNMNVVDPLRVDNNLGRSINKGNFFRICSAFAYGAKQIEKMFRGSPEEFAEKLDEFFRNTKKPCNGYGPDCLAPSLVNVEIPDTSRMTKDSQEVADHANQPSNGNSNQTSIVSEDVKKGIVNRGRRAVPLVYEASEMASGSKTDFSSTNGVLKQTAESVPSASKLTVNSREYIENARDLASHENGYNGFWDGSWQADPSAAIPSSCYHHSPLIHGSQIAMSTMNLMVDQQPAMHISSSPNPGILTGDLETYLFNLQACRLMVTSHFYGPLMFASALVLPAGHLFEHYASEGPGRPTNGDINMFTQAFAYNNHGQYLNPSLQGLSLQNAFALPTNGVFRLEAPKLRRGTGTYLPNLKPGLYRDAQLMSRGKGSANVAKSLECNDTVNQDEVNAFASKYTHGRARHEERLNPSKFNTHPEKSRTFERNSLEKGWRALQEDRLPSYYPPTTTSVANGETASSFTSQAPELGPFMVRDAKQGEKNSHIGDTHMPPPSFPAMDHPYADNKDNGFLVESLEFGSLGSPILGRSKKAVVHDDVGKDPEGLRLENIQKLKLGDDIEPGEVTARKVLFDDNEQRSLQCSYELKDEDFPPLSSSGQPRMSTDLHA